MSFAFSSVSGLLVMRLGIVRLMKRSMSLFHRISGLNAGFSLRQQDSLAQMCSGRDTVVQGCSELRTTRKRGRAGRCATIWVAAVAHPARQSPDSSAETRRPPDRHADHTRHVSAARQYVAASCVGYDTTSVGPLSGELRSIKIKGLAGSGGAEVLLTTHERRVA